MINFEHYRDFISNSIDEAYRFIASPNNDFKSALLCVLEVMDEMKILLDELVENAKDPCGDCETPSGLEG